MLYVIYYRIIGARENGNYLINANNAKHARRILKQIDSDYVADEVMRLQKDVEQLGYKSLQQAIEDGMYEQSEIDEVSKKIGNYVQVEEGT